MAEALHQYDVAILGLVVKKRLFNGKLLLAAPCVQAEMNHVIMYWPFTTVGSLQFIISSFVQNVLSL